jgi:CheY-like chemotaxis protein
MRKTPLILLVEDDEDTYELYSDVLASAGYDVVGADNGLEAETTVLQVCPDLVIMDVALPGCNGLEAARHLKSNERTRSVPILAMSGFVQSRCADLALKSGCDAYLGKPCPLEQLLAEVERLLSLAVRRPRRVLIVEDDEDVRALLQAVLNAVGFAVDTAENGREALRHLHQTSNRPDLILLDLMMPVMNGWQLRAALRHEPAFSSIPIVVMTALHPTDEPAEGLDVSEYLIKPIDTPQLIGAVERFC